MRTPPALDQLTSRYCEQLWVRELDVTDTAQLRRGVNAAFAELGRIDVVVSNAGYGLLGAAEELTDAQIQTNLIASIQLARAVIPISASRAVDGSCNSPAAAGQIRRPALSLYNATKSAIEGFYESIAPEIAPFGIDTCLVEPGNARTDLQFRSRAEAPAIDDYAATPAGQVRAAVHAQRPIDLPGDVAKMATAMIDAADANQLPNRLLLGSDAFQ
ncbi:MAG: SDR family NAD(P)-dependent oxidoreductase, partial [Solirubrobacterales bacterium]|nr:SDR family NAD(P)-dependent oxidoreductase [Solirubrobacterales bacterium]